MSQPWAHLGDLTLLGAENWHLGLEQPRGSLGSSGAIMRDAKSVGSYRLRPY